MPLSSQPSAPRPLAPGQVVRALRAAWEPGDCKVGEVVRAPRQREFQAERGRAQTLPAAWCLRSGSFFQPQEGNRWLWLARYQDTSKRDRDPRSRGLTL